MNTKPFKLNASTRLKAYHLVMAEKLKEYQKRLKKLGIKTLGQGNFADVFQHPTMPNVVVKLLTENDKGYEKYVAFSEQHKGNKYVPKILGVHKEKDVFEGELDPDLHLVFMEKLRPIEDDEYMEFGQYILDLGTDGATPSIMTSMTDHLNDLPRWKSIARQTKDKDMAELAKFFLANAKGKVNLDLHDGNMMMRGSKPVITDPFSTYD